MPTPATDWAADRRLDILILGPMGDKDQEPSTLRIRDAEKAPSETACE